MFKKKRNLIFFILVVALLSSCSTVGYYGQSVVGHTKLMLSRQNIDKAIERSKGEHKKQLQLAKDFRRFAVTDLSLPDNNSYLSYVGLKRKYPVWSVVAAPEFSLRPTRWCYPVIGCAAYRGYFSENRAKKYASGLVSKGFETHVGGASAYSTLGWFSDPLIPSMMRNGDVSLAQVMFHELAHQQLYIKGNSAFNEAFATVVGEHGALKWLKKNRPESVTKYESLMAVRNDFSAFIKTYKQRLKSLYDSSDNVEDKRTKKQQLHTEMLTLYEDIVEQKWLSKRWYGQWMKNPPNNAKLAAFATYRDLVPAFEKLLGECQYDYKKFYNVVSQQKGKGREAVIATQCH